MTLNEKLIRTAIAVAWVLAVQWFRAYICKDLPPFHWAGFPGFLTGMAVSFFGAAAILIWERKEPT